MKYSNRSQSLTSDGCRILESLENLDGYFKIFKSLECLGDPRYFNDDDNN